MNDKINEILEDLDEFHKSISNVKKINDSFYEYIEAIRNEKTIIDNYNQDKINKVITLQDNLEKYIESLKNSIQDFIKGENKFIANSYDKFIVSIEENNKFINESCNQYLTSITKQDDILKENQELIKNELINTINKLEEELMNSVKLINEQQNNLNNYYIKVIKSIGDSNLLANDFKNYKKNITVIFRVFGFALVIIIVLLIINLFM